MTDLEAAVAAATRAWFTPRQGPPTEPYLPAKARAHRIRFEGGDLSGFTVGSGAGTVLLVHGWGSSVSQLGDFVPALAATGRRVAGFDLPAHGASSGTETDVLAMSRAIRHVAASLGDVSAVVAHSIGAPATVTAVGQGLGLDAVAFVAPGVRLVDALDVFLRRAELPPPVAAGLREEIEQRFGAEVWDELQMDRAVADIDLPALLVHDPADRQAPIASVRAAARAWPGARLVEVEGLGHNRILADAEVIAMVASFVEDAARSRV